jgi:hypothetical protein
MMLSPLTYELNSVSNPHGAVPTAPLLFLTDTATPACLAVLQSLHETTLINTAEVEEIMKKYKNEKGECHRVDGPAVEYIDSSKEWFINGKLHRIDGPAIEDTDGTKSWWVDGQLHRVDGPAIEWGDGSKFWYIDGKRLTEEEFNNHPKVMEYRFNKILQEEVL